MVRCILIFGMLFSGTTIAQNEEEEEEEQEIILQTTVTGTRVSGSANKLVTTDTITGESLDERGARTVGDAMQQVAGVQVGSSFGTGQELSIDGLDGKYVLILIDGRPVNGRVNDRVDISRLPISPSDIERIEIVRGPMSALYGSEALGGVVNIITKRAQEGINGSVELGSRFFGRGVSRENLAAHLDGGKYGIKGKLAISLMQQKATDEGSRDADGNISEIPDGAYDTPDRRQANISGEIYVTPTTAWLIRAYGSLSYNEVETKVSSVLPTKDSTTNTEGQLGFVAQGDVADNHTLFFDVRLNRYSHRFAKKPNAGELTVTPFCNGQDVKSGFDDDCPAPDVPRTEAFQNEMRAEARYTTHILEGLVGANELNLSTGINFVAENVERLNGDGVDTIPGYKERYTGAQYTELLYKPFDLWTILAGYRMDLALPGPKDEEFFFAVGPKVTTAVDILEYMTVKFSYGQGYRLPSFTERYLRFDHSELGYVVNGNTDLLPETNEGFRMELSTDAIPYARLGIEGFLNRVENQIGFIETGRSNAGVLQYRYGNIDRSTSSGLNLRAGLLAIHGFSSDIGYTYLARAHDISACAEELGPFCSEDDGASRLPFQPTHSVHIGMRYLIPVSQTRIFTQLDINSRRPIDDGTFAAPSYLWGIGVHQPLWKGATVIASLQNILDQYGPVYGPKPGRYLDILFRQNFDAIGKP